MLFVTFLVNGEFFSQELLIQKEYYFIIISLLLLFLLLFFRILRRVSNFEIFFRLNHIRFSIRSKAKANKSVLTNMSSLTSQLPSSSSSSEDTIIKELHSIYVDAEDGLLPIGQGLGLHNLNAPRRKINILLIGNHSSGKSSFINWYMDDKIQKTSVAIETQGFTIVTNGKSREKLIGKSVLHLYPYLKQLESIDGVLANLNVELTPVKSRQSHLINFIDTPGLVDGELHYPFEIEKAIIHLGNISDLIFVFFDPIGQALCKRTLNLVEKLNNLYNERMRFFLTKADEAGDEPDRQKIMMQIVQELCKRKGLNRSGFDMMAIYLPNITGLKQREQMCSNQIDDVCQEINKAIVLHLQKTFNTMERDINQLDELADNKLKTFNTDLNSNLIKFLKLIFFILVCLQLPADIFLNPNGSISRFLSKYIPKDQLLVCSFIIILPLIFLYHHQSNFEQKVKLLEMMKAKKTKQKLNQYRTRYHQLLNEYLDKFIDK